MDTNTVGPPTEKTLRNVKQARSHSLWVGPVHIEYKFWTGFFKFIPKWQTMTTEFWNEGPVRWFRCYWLTFGLSIYKLLPEQRIKEEQFHIGDNISAPYTAVLKDRRKG